MISKCNYQELLDRAKEAKKLSSPCRLCPRRCGVNRTAGETGFCRIGPDLTISRVLPHFGEEPPISGRGGAGTVFFANCNMSCVYCQNHQISQDGLGSLMACEELAAQMLGLQSHGCATLEPVSPTHQLPAFLEALAQAVKRGLDLPIVYNTNGFECQETLALLEGIVDVYLPDLKYAHSQHAERYSCAPGYVEFARSAIMSMHRQVGDLVVTTEGLASRGLIVRHLVLPGDISGTKETLRWIKDKLSTSVTLSIMSQYVPMYKATAFGELNRKIIQEEYDRALDLAWDMGFENVFIQDMQSTELGTPDFTKEDPFDWDEKNAVHHN